MRFDEFMLQKGFYRCKHYNCVYFKVLSDKSYIYLLLYVDDMLIASRSMTDITRLKLQLNSEFEMKDLGGACKILGMDPKRQKGW